LREGDDERSVSQGSLGETNKDTNLTSSNKSSLGRCFAVGISEQDIGVAKAVSPNFFIKASMGRFFLDKLF
jgi:hypothetical protein